MPQCDMLSLTRRNSWTIRWPVGRSQNTC